MARINSQLKEWFFCVVALAVVEVVGILVNSQLASPVDISDTITYAALVMLYFLTSYRYARRHPKRFYLIGVPLLLVILVLLYMSMNGVTLGSLFVGFVMTLVSVALVELMNWLIFRFMIKNDKREDGE